MSDPCKLQIKIAGQEIEVDLGDISPDQPITTDLIMQRLKKDKKALNLLVDQVRNKKNTVKNTPFTLTKIKQYHDVLPNYNVEQLRTDFPEIDFPENIEADVLLVKDLIINTKDINGRVINSNGREVFVIKLDDNKQDLYRFAKYLKLKAQLQTFQFDENSREYKILKAISKDEDYTELLLDFSQNKSKYNKSFIFKEDNGTKVKLNKMTELIRISNIILSNPNRTFYSNQFINDLNTSIMYIRSKEENKKSVRLISINDYYKLLKTASKSIKNYLSVEHQAILDNITKNKENFDEFIKNEEAFKEFHNALITIEPDFQLEFDSIYKNSIYFTYVNREISTKYGMGYDTMYTFKKENYRGYNIYSRVNDKEEVEYFIVKGTLTDSATQKRLIGTKESFLEEAKKIVDNKVESEVLMHNSLLPFKYRMSVENKNGDRIWDTDLDNSHVQLVDFYRQHQIVESLKIPIDENTPICPKERKFIDTKERLTVKDFYNYIDSLNLSQGEQIKSLLDSSEKIMTFIYKANEKFGDNRNNGQKLLKLAKTISKAEYEYYYIQYGLKVGTENKYTVIKVPSEVVANEYKHNKTYPIIYMLNTLATKLQSQFGINCKTMTASEIHEKFPDVDANTARAFIRNGIVYINTTIATPNDVIHEYVHLLMGYLRIVQPENYQKILELLVETKEGKYEFDRIAEVYPDMSQIGQMEEVFARLFSKYIYNNLSPGAESVFSQVNLKDSSKTIFGMEIDDVKLFYSRNMSTIFKKLNQEIGDLLSEEKQINFGNTKRYREISNYISKQIKNEQIKEECK